jgi:hypothetical protein
MVMVVNDEEKKERGWSGPEHDDMTARALLNEQIK